MDIKKELKQIQNRVGQYEERLSKLEDFLTGQRKAKKKKLSLREFILLKSPTNDVQQTLCIGYFLENYNGLSSFNKKDLEKAFRKAREKLPQNVNDKVNLNIKKGHMVEASEKKDNLKAWNLTNSGREEVERLGKGDKTL